MCAPECPCEFPRSHRCARRRFASRRSLGEGCRRAVDRLAGLWPLSLDEQHTSCGTRGSRARVPARKVWVLMGRCFLAHDLVGDQLTPCLLKHLSICTHWEVVYLDPANSIGSRRWRGNLTPSRAKFREGFAVLLLIFSCPHIAINSSNVGYFEFQHPCSAWWYSRVARATSQTPRAAPVRM